MSPQGICHPFQNWHGRQGYTPKYGDGFAFKSPPASAPNFLIFPVSASAGPAIKVRLAAAVILPAEGSKEQQAIEAGDAARQAVAKADAARRKAETRERDFTNRIDRIDRLKDAPGRI